jgi:hypothetical protein
VTDGQRQKIARDRAKVIVQQLKASNERAERKGAPTVDEKRYRGLEQTVARKLLRAS